MRRPTVIIVMSLVLSACSVTPTVEPASLPTSTTSSTTSAGETTVTSSPPMPTTSVRPTSPLAALVTPAGSAIPAVVPPAQGPAPTAVTIESIGVDTAPIVPVGVLEDGQMEIPGRTEVGWYRFGSSPGDPGSAVLAAHIAFDNRAGVFRRLSSVQLSDIVEVTFDDDTVRRFEVFELAQYGKTELPFDRVFASEGPSMVTLISCGGVFDRTVGSYEDNIVAYARPIAD